MSLKLIQDPSTGKPRGFGFCEYEDAETAMSACRNLVGRELNGRPLRIDSAMNAPGENMKGSVTIPGGPIEPPVHGPMVPPEEAPEAITKAVASLPPEQMFELMKQMKWCIQYNPNETRQLLSHNSQLAYALLQAQVVMRIVDLEKAQTLLHRSPRGPPLHTQGTPHGNPFIPHPGGGRELYREHLSSRGPPPPPPPPPRSMRTHDHRGPPSDFLRGPSSSSEGMNSQDQERTALLMQVLSLSDDQIKMLPSDQRNNILRLKDQLAQTRQ